MKMRYLKGFLCAIHGWVPGFGIVNDKPMCKHCANSLGGEICETRSKR